MRPRTDGRLSAEFGALLRQARGATPIDEFADTHNLTKATLSMLERGLDNPTLDRVERMASAYGITVTITLAPKPAHNKTRRPTQETLTP